MSARDAGSRARREFRCTYCQRVFRKLEHLQRHVRRHTNEKPFVCSCGAAFSRRDLLRRHERVGCASSGYTLSSPGHGQQPRQQRNSQLRDVSSPIYNATTPISSQGLQAYDQPVGHGNNLPLANTGSAPSLNQLSTILPFPQLSLASQIVPHFASPVVTPADRSRLLSSLSRLSKDLPELDLPSCNALTRYLAGFFTGFYPHTPFTHAPTFRLETTSPELCLAMMAVGAIDRFEITMAKKLFSLAKTMLFDNQQQGVQRGHQTLMANNGSSLIDQLRCLLCLAQFAAWRDDSDLKHETPVLKSLLVQTLRLSGLGETAQPARDPPWEHWAEQESERRTKMFAFCFLIVHGTAYDEAPSIWADEINLILPCSCPEWTAPDATAWSLLRQNIISEQGRFNRTLDVLLSSSDCNDSGTCYPTPVGNYVLIHGLLQMILWTPQFLLRTVSSKPVNDAQSIYESGLRQWTSYWQNTPESSLQPLDPNGPLPFTSTALLSLAYVRNATGPCRSRMLFTWSPTQIAHELRSSRPPERNWPSLLAAYHATNLLSTLVGLGIQYVSRNQTILWGIEATLAGLDCAVFLEKWLRQMQAAMTEVPLTDMEAQVFDWVREVVHEGLLSIDEASSPSTVLPDHIITIWSHVMRGNSPFPFIELIGDVLVEYNRLSTGI